MRRLLGLVLACLLLASCSAQGQAQPGSRAEDRGSVAVDTPALRELKAAAGIEACPRGEAGSELPPVTLPCLGGGRDVDLSTLRGPMVVNLFAQWCGPCREELPYYQTLHRKAKGQVAVLGVDYLDTQPAQALALARSSGVTYPLVADPDGRLRTELKIRGLPGIVFVDRSGKVVDVQFRLITSYGQLRDLVRQHLGVRLPA